MNPGLVGGVAGCVVGAIGGIIGTWYTIRRTAGPRERAFTIKASAIGWVAAIVFIVLLVALPAGWRWFVWAPYAILLPVGITCWNRTQQRIREEESAGAQQPSAGDPQKEP